MYNTQIKSEPKMTGSACSSSDINFCDAYKKDEGNVYHVMSMGQRKNLSP